MMARHLLLLLLVLLTIAVICKGYAVNNRPRSTRKGTSSRLDLFGGLFGGGKPKSTGAAEASVIVGGKAVDAKKLEEMRKGLEKVSNTQGRDWQAESKRLKEEADKKKVVVDKQISAYNFGKANEFPNLYKGWIKANGGQIENQMIKATKAALAKQEKYIEVLFDPVPNLDEVAFGTEWNQRLRKEVASNLKVPDFACNRGGPSTLEWSNIYWANKLAAALGGNIVGLSISGEGTKGQYLPTLTKGFTLMNIADARKPEALKQGDVSALIVLSPCAESHYATAKALGDRLSVPVICLNSPYSYRYDVGGGKPFTLAYVMKRIPKGWIFRQFPGAFEAIIEGPEYEVFKAQTFSTQPSLPENSKVSMSASAEKYGKTGNDRIFQNRL